MGFKVYGQGFVFDDSDPTANSINLMRELIASDARNKQCIFPYIGGAELNSHPTQLPHRYVINFEDRTQDEAAQWPDLLDILRVKVYPERQKLKRRALAERWWQYGERQPSLVNAVKNLDRVLVIARIGQHCAFSFLPSGIVYSEALVVFALDTWRAFAILQSRVHEFWTRFFASSMKDDLRYTASDCFDSFPFPALESFELDKIGQIYFENRANLMLVNNEGLTATYNRFHSPDVRDAGIMELRRLHGLMDAAVLRAYGWDDLAESATCEFLLDYEEDEDDSSSDSSNSRQKKKPWRYRWPDAFRDEVLARLLELNEQRHKEELLLVKGKSTEAKPAKESNKKAAKAKATPLLDGLDQVELSRDQRLILLIVDAFKLITRPAIDEAFIAMKYPKLRKSRLGLGKPPKSVPRTDPGRDTLIDGLVVQGFLEQHPSDHQQIWKLAANAPSLTATAAERQALEETQAIFQKSIDSGDSLASCTEGVTDAQPGLISVP